MRMRARNVTVTRGVRVHLLHDSLGDYGPSWGEWTVASAKSGRTSTASAFWHNLDLVRNCVLSALVVGIRARDFAVGGFVIYPLDTSNGNRGRGIGPLCFSSCGAAFGGIGEMLIALGFWDAVRMTVYP